MGFLSGQSDVEKEFGNNWTYTPIANDNVAFSPQGLSEWVRITDLNADGKQISLGNRPSYRYRGMVVVQIFVKPNTGSGRHAQLSDYVTSIFRSKRIGAVQFYVPAVTKIGPRDGWYQVNVNCPYDRNED